MMNQLHNFVNRYDNVLMILLLGVILFALGALLVLRKKLVSVDVAFLLSFLTSTLGEFEIGKNTFYI